jgi:hypothetical protein
MDKLQVRRFLEGMVVGGAGLAAVLFGTGFAVRSDIAEHDARQMSRHAVAERLADICVWKYEHAPDHRDKLADLKALEYWKRSDYVGKQGWATMPGDKAPRGDVAEECATRLADLSN